MRRAKIVATLGPASSDRETLTRLLRAGVDIVRLNLSHGTHDEHRATLRRVREVSAELSLHVPAIIDLMGPRYRLGEVSGGPRRLEPGQTVRLAEPGAGAELTVDEPALLAHLRPGERMLIDDGLVELEVEECGEGAVRARVIAGGEVASRKGINLPDSDLPFEISAKDRADIELAVQEQADFLGASYVGSAADLAALRRALERAGGGVPLVAKLERGRALEHLEAIVEGADAVMVARGDLGVEVPLDRVPVLQKRIIEVGRRLGKPVIVATQMLESMLERPRPTRAESSDVANAIFDGADALMLSGETAAGRHPVEAVEVMDRIIRAAEEYEGERHAPSERSPLPAQESAPRPVGLELEEGARGRGFEIADVVAGSAVLAAQRLAAERIVAFSQSGFTARMVARYRPSASVLMATADPRVARRVQLLWGVRPLLLEEQVEELDELIGLLDRELAEKGLTRPGEPVVILMGDPIRERPPTNLMRVHRLGGG